VRRFLYQATIIRVVDGDGVVADVDLGFRITHRITARLYGINAPEMRTAAGPPAKGALAALVLGKQLEVETVRDRTDKFGRMLLTIYFDDGTSVNDWLVTHGYAVPYLP
jgi:micrococcal nuclease